ncbi:MAG: hypothetical protein WC269_06480 [Candidatus Gracilibacteria bacterium]|jgi:hypothetical protein
MIKLLAKLRILKAVIISQDNGEEYVTRLLVSSRGTKYCYRYWGTKTGFIGLGDDGRTKDTVYNGEWFEYPQKQFNPIKEAERILAE